LIDARPLGVRTEAISMLKINKRNENKAMPSVGVIHGGK
jgi:hypothetical protein